MGTGVDGEKSRYKKMEVDWQIWVAYDGAVAHSLEDVCELIHSNSAQVGV